MGSAYKALEGNSSEGRQDGGEAKRWRAGCVAEGGGDADTLRGHMEGTGSWRCRVQICRGLAMQHTEGQILGTGARLRAVQGQPGEGAWKVALLSCDKKCSKLNGDSEPRLWILLAKPGGRVRVGLQ